MAYLREGLPLASVGRRSPVSSAKASPKRTSRNELPMTKMSPMRW